MQHKMVTEKASTEDCAEARPREVMQIAEVDRQNAVGESFWQRRVRPFLDHVTVEPMLFFHAASFTMIFVMMQSLKLSRVCRVTYNQSEETCLNLTAHPHLQQSIQRSTSDLGMYWTIIQTVPSITFALFIAPWSDRLGRKKFMMIGLIGAILGALVMVFVSYFEKLPPEYLLLAPAITSVTGDFAGMSIAVHSYIADLTPEDSRTMRMAFVTGIWLLGSPVGSAVAGILITYTSFFVIFSLCASLFALCLMYVIIRIKDVLRCPERNQSILAQVSSNCKESFLVYVIKRPANNRMYLWILIICMCGVSLPVVGELNARFLYVKLKFNWNDATYSYYMAVAVAASAIANIVILPLLSNKVKLSDVSLALIAVSARIVTDLVIVLSVDSWMMFVSILPIMGETAGCPIRSLMSKCIAENEVGKIFSLLAIVEVGLPLISGALYSKLYNATIHLFPATVFVLSICIYVVVIAILVFLHFDMKRVRTKDAINTPLDEEIEENNSTVPYVISSSMNLEKIETTKGHDAQEIQETKTHLNGYSSESSNL